MANNLQLNTSLSSLCLCQEHISQCQTALTKTPEIIARSSSFPSVGPDPQEAISETGQYSSLNNSTMLHWCFSIIVKSNYIKVKDENQQQVDREQ